jgi:hypothetical protein
MKRTVALLLFAIALALPCAAKEKHKIKEKRFEPAPLARAADAAGTYVGPDSSYVITLTSENGKLTGFMVLAGVRQPLTGIEVAGTRFEARWDGQRVEGTFLRRILNGQAAFGLLLEAPPIDLGGGTVSQPFYRRLTP